MIIRYINLKCTHFIPTIASNKIFRPNCEGGLSIRKTEYLNVSHLAKQGWKFLTQLDSLWVQLISTKYLNKNNQNFPKSRTASNTWKHILDYRNLLKKRLVWVEMENLLTFHMIIGWWSPHLLINFFLIYLTLLITWLEFVILFSHLKLGV